MMTMFGGGADRCATATAATAARSAAAAAAFFIGAILALVTVLSFSDCFSRRHEDHEDHERLCTRCDRSYSCLRVFVKRSRRSGVGVGGLLIRIGDFVGQAIHGIAN